MSTGEKTSKPKKKPQGRKAPRPGVQKPGEPTRGPQTLNVLFTCVGRRVGLIRAFRSAIAELGLQGELVGTDITPAAPGLYVVDHSEQVPSVRSLPYVPTLLELVEKHHISLLVPLTDLDLRVLARRKEEFAARGCTVMIAPEEVVNTCRNKIEFNHLLAKAGLQGIRTETLDSFRKNEYYPCFAKPIYGSASIGAACIKSKRELDAHIASFGEQLMVQEWVEGQEFTVDIFRRRDGVVCAVVPRQRLTIRSGEVEKGITVKDPEIINAALRLVEQMPGLWGVMNAQCRRGPDGEPRFFEANLRFGGGALLSIAAGVNLPKYVLMETLGMEVPPAVGEFTDKLLMLRYDEAIYTQVDDPSGLPGFGQPLSK